MELISGLNIRLDQVIYLNNAKLECGGHRLVDNPTNKFIMTNSFSVKSLLPYCQLSHPNLILKCKSSVVVLSLKLLRLSR